MTKTEHRAATGYANPQFLISAEDLAQRLGEPGLVVLDATTTLVPARDRPFEVVSGRPAFEEGHIPGARHVDIERDLSIPADGLMFTLPPVGHFAEAASLLGIGEGSFVAVYSTAQPGWAARVWLMLRAFGFRNAAVLDGGFAAWREAGLPIETGTEAPLAGAVAPFAWRRPERGHFVGLGEAEAAAMSGNAKLVNALPPDVFAGTASLYYGRPGHIPGSVNIPTGSLADPSTGRYLGPERMEGLFAAQGIDPTDRVIAYCGAGVAASNIVFARLLLGHEDAAVFDGSMLEWTADPSRPVVGPT